MKTSRRDLSKAGDQEGDDPTFLMPGDIQPTWKLMPTSQLRLMASRRLAESRLYGACLGETHPDFSLPKKSAVKVW
jgi:hypothetical protein